MASEITQRVKKHRADRGIVWGEVEVPDAEDAAAVRRFAREQRQGGCKSRLAAAATPERIARNFLEIAEMQGRAGGPKNDEIET